MSRINRGHLAGIGGTALVLFMMTAPASRISPPPPTECETRSQEVGAEIAAMWKNAGAATNTANSMGNIAAEGALKACKEKERIEPE